MCHLSLLDRVSSSCLGKWIKDSLSGSRDSVVSIFLRGNEMKTITGCSYILLFVTFIKMTITNTETLITKMKTFMIKTKTVMTKIEMIMTKIKTRSMGNYM